MTESANTTTAVSINLSLSDFFLMGILTTAVEGGSNYWASICDIDRGDTGQGLVRACNLVDREGCGAKSPAGSSYAVNLTTVRVGVERALSQATRVSPHVVAAIYGDLRSDRSEIDAEAADVIVQLGLFGEVVYG